MSPCERENVLPARSARDTGKRSPPSEGAGRSETFVIINVCVVNFGYKQLGGYI